MLKVHLEKQYYNYYRDEPTTYVSYVHVLRSNRGHRFGSIVRDICLASSSAVVVVTSRYYDGWIHHGCVELILDLLVILMSLRVLSATGANKSQMQNSQWLAGVRELKDSQQS